VVALAVGDTGRDGASVTTLIAKASDVTVDAAKPTLATTRKPAATARASHEKYRGIDDAPCGMWDRSERNCRTGHAQEAFTLSSSALGMRSAQLRD
jgi:hypothetical protein